MIINCRSKEKKIFYSKIGFSENDIIFLYVGRIYQDKGVLELIKSFNKIKTQKDNIKLLIVGQKRNNSRENNIYYDKILYEKQKNNNSIFLYGNATSDELRVLYNISNIQIIPTLCEEAFGLVLLEGMSAKKKLIITNSGGMVEVANEDVKVVNKNAIGSILNLSDFFFIFYVIYCYLALYLYSLEFYSCFLIIF